MTNRWLMLLGLAGCVETDALDETLQESVSTNGVSLNGVSMNGVSMNGVSMNGVSMNGVSMNGVSMNGVSMNGVSMNGVSMNGVSMNGVSMNGVSMNGVSMNGVSMNGTSYSGSAIGATLTGLLSNGVEIPLRIDSAVPLTGTNSDVWSYGVSFESDLGWQPLCGDPSVGALFVPGTWNTQFGLRGGGSYSTSSGAFTFACRGMTIAKCVEMGYKPSLGHTDHMLACVRMLRGDYCGDGTAYTVTGHQVNLFDNIGIQADTMDWKFEAEWTPEGARCISNESKTRFYENGLVPTCVAAGTLSENACNSSPFENGALLVSELPKALTVVKVLAKTVSKLISK